MPEIDPVLAFRARLRLVMLLSNYPIFVKKFDDGRALHDLAAERGAPACPMISSVVSDLDLRERVPSLARVDSPYALG